MHCICKLYHPKIIRSRFFPIIMGSCKYMIFSCSIDIRIIALAYLLLCTACQLPVYEKGLQWVQIVFVWFAILWTALVRVNTLYAIIFVYKPLFQNLINCSRRHFAGVENWKTHCRFPRTSQIISVLTCLLPPFMYFFFFRRSLTLEENYTEQFSVKAY